MRFSLPSIRFRWAFTLPALALALRRLRRADIHGCLKCAHRETRERAGVEHADPGRCDYCNP